jgi:hypothetical protein
MVSRQKIILSKYSNGDPPTISGEKEMQIKRLDEHRRGQISEIKA